MEARVDPMGCLLVLTTLPASADAGALAGTLVDERLAACVNILPPMESIYRWQGTVEREAERQVVVKTSADRFEALAARLRALHPYDLPELIALPIVQGSDAYLAWVREMTRPVGPG